MGAGATMVAYGDLTGAKVLDMVTANPTGESISVRFGNGDGTFGPEVDYPIAGSHPYHPYALALGDINGDGHLDVVVANLADNNVAILLNDGKGNLEAPSFIAVDSPSSVALGDLRKLGHQDLVVASNLDTEISVFLNDGEGNLSAPTHYAAGKAPAQVVLVDVNDDGTLDAVTANEKSYTGPTPWRLTLDNFEGGVTTMLGNGDGTIGAPIVSNVGALSTSLALGKFTGDGSADVVVADGTEEAQVSVGHGNGYGTFTLLNNYPTGSSLPVSVALGDLDRSGRLSIATANQAKANVSVLFGNGDGTFAPAQLIATAPGSFPGWVSIDDLLGDGHGELSVANNFSNNVSVYLPLSHHLDAALYDSGGTLLAIGDTTASNLNQLIKSFVAPAAGKYYIKISGTGISDYSLIVTRGADFHTHPNGNQVEAQRLDGTQTVLGAIVNPGFLYSQEGPSNPYLTHETDPSTGAFLTTFNVTAGVPANNPFGNNLAFDGTSLYFNDGAFQGDNNIYKLDPNTGAVQGSITPQEPFLLTGIAYLDGELSGTDTYNIYEFDINTGAVLTQFSGVLDGPAMGLAGDPDRHALWARLAVGPDLRDRSRYRSNHQVRLRRPRRIRARHCLCQERVAGVGDRRLRQCGRHQRHFGIRPRHPRAEAARDTYCARVHRRAGRRRPRRILRGLVELQRSDGRSAYFDDDHTLRWRRPVPERPHPADRSLRRQRHRGSEQRRPTEEHAPHVERPEHGHLLRPNHGRQQLPGRIRTSHQGKYRRFYAIHGHCNRRGARCERRLLRPRHGDLQRGDPPVVAVRGGLDH
jgi:outer membrane protein assembly factor BamB